jgi:hypothetical protein
MTKSNNQANPLVFISYSWDSPQQKLWVESFAQLVSPGQEGLWKVLPGRGIGRRPADRTHMALRQLNANSWLRMGYEPSQDFFLLEAYDPVWQQDIEEGGLRRFLNVQILKGP